MFKFSMPMGEVLEVIPSKEIGYEADIDEEIEGVIWNINWEGKLLPFNTRTRYQAIMLAFGCQWGAQEEFRRNCPF